MIARLGFASSRIALLATALVGIADAATITVNSVADSALNDGQCTLREAIIAANTNTASGTVAGECAAGTQGPDTIAFNIPGSGVRVVALSSALPAITETVTIDGYTQPGAVANTLQVGSNATLMIQMSGRTANSVLRLDGAGSSGSAIRGLVINQYDAFAIDIANGSAGNAVTGNFIGVGANGTVAAVGDGGIRIRGGSANTIGGMPAATYNVIAAGGTAIVIDASSNNIVRRNYIGINAGGTAALPVDIGVDVTNGSTGTVIGESPIFINPSNVIGNFTSAGIVLDAVSGTKVQGNMIGTNATGTSRLTAGGVGIVAGDGTDNMIGGSGGPAHSGAGNLISSAETGILVDGTGTGWLIEGNRIGTSAGGDAGSTPMGNLHSGICVRSATARGKILGNAIAFNGAQGVTITAGSGWEISQNVMKGNGGLGIALNPRCDLPAMPVANHAGDSDIGPNNLQNAPVITSALRGSNTLAVAGTLNSTPRTTFRIEFFFNEACDPSGYGEGGGLVTPGFAAQVVGGLDTINVTTDASGNAAFDSTLNSQLVGLIIFKMVTATATDSAGNTSEFSACATLLPDTRSAVPVIEFYNALLDHYFMTWKPDEIAKLDAGIEIKGWTRTGNSFKAFSASQSGTSPGCRYYIPPALGDSHFFGRNTLECNATGAKFPTFIVEDMVFMYMYLPGAGVCPEFTIPVYRVFSNRADANHRYMTSRALRDQMVATGWLAEGDGPDLVVTCAPE